jgi:hypothetical protein
MKLLATTLVALSLVPVSGTAVEPFARAWDGAGISSARGPFPPTLEAIQANVFSPSCAMSFCHGEGMAANLDLRPGASYSNLVNVPSVEVPPALRVEPYDPDGSYLICKLENCSWIVGSQMPLIGGPLDQSVIDVIREWIGNGAPETPVSVSASTWGGVKALYR